MDEIDERRGVGRLGAAETAHEPSGFAARDELFRVDVRQGGDPEAGLSDQLGEHTTWPERNEWAEDWVLQETGKQLGSAAEHRLHDDGETDSLCGCADGRFVLEVERDAAGLGLVSARGGRLDDSRESQLGGRPTALRRPRRSARGRRADRRRPAAPASRRGPARSPPSGRVRARRRAQRQRDRRRRAKERSRAVAGATRRARPTRPSARAADSGYANAAAAELERRASGTPAELMTTARTGFSEAAARAAASTATAT